MKTANKPKNKILSLLIAVCLVLVIAPVTASAEDGGSSHVHDGDCGYIEGSDYSHKHDENCGGLPPEATSPDPAEWQNPFADVKSADWFYGDVRYAHENGLISGTSSTTFTSNLTLSRAMLVTIGHDTL